MAKQIRPGLRTVDLRTARPIEKKADPELLTPEHRAWRELVLQRAAYRCEWIEDGRRCTKSAPQHRLIADHIKERKDGGAALDPINGQCLCVQHNTLKGIQARAERMKVSF
ncbi:MAG: HNH endonuclease [Mesorhizobium sp.]|uniref:HNH endonuclease signature motif containing protein n=1 Tax=Mesorhizobium sp. TaxID=1871066 RepID=UPI001223E5CF|nr:HNH endonuclease signature motif containing protein [Mesorhizobium sp.]TJV51144.1 MAG: HNH endonuclease [Mesorhizobium sp.]